MAVACALAFKRGSYGEGVRLMRRLEHPEHVAIVFRLLTNIMPRSMKPATVSLLHLAAYHGWLDIVMNVKLKVLYECKDSVGRTPLHYAAVGGSLPVVQYLITVGHCNPATLGLNNSTLLHYACVGGHMNIINYLITELQCDPTVHSNDDGCLPLHVTCQYGHLKLTKFLINEKNCDPKIRDLNGWTLLHYASIGGHMNIIEYLITELHCDPTIRNNYSSLPLHIACRHGHLNITNFFITEQNCDPTMQDLNGWTLLHHASRGGHMNIVKYLITELHCDPTICDNYGSLPLHIACHHGHLNITKYFTTEQNCDPEDQDKDGCTPLHYASRGGHMNIVKYLITELHCDPTIHDNYSSLSLHFACQHGHLNLTKYFTAEQNCDPKWQNLNGWTPLLCASEGGHVNIVEYLITQLHCDPTVHNNYGYLPLHIACLNGHLYLTKYFTTEQNCDPKSQDLNGWTPLHHASEGGHMNIVEYLITELHCDPTVCDNGGSLPLHIACHNGHLNLTKYFITEQNCDPNSQNLNDLTPLLCASEGGHVNIVEYLITELHCDPTVHDKYGHLPLHVACFHGHLNLTKYFTTEQNCDPTSPGLDGWTPLHYASQGGHMNIVECLITELHCDPIICDNYGCLPLHIACRHSHLNLTKYFTTEQNCDPTSQDLKGWTPLHYASEGGHMNIVEYLITELHCDPMVCNSIGSLPLHVACCYGHLDLAKYFITEQKCDPTSLNDDGMTALHYACEKGHNQIVQCIIANRNCDNLFDSVTRSSFYLTKGINFESGQISSISRLFCAREVSVKELFYTYTEVMKEFPIHSYNKVILTGNSAAGKTTLTAVIAERAATHFNWFKIGNVQQVELNTAGIQPSHVKSREVGNLVLYDLAGHAEYHTSHYAVMQTVIKESPATFINVVDLSKSYTEITQQLFYWLNFINNVTCRTSASKSCLIIVGSHADLIAREILDEKQKFVSDLVQKGVKRHILEFVDVVSMDCRKIDSGSTRKFTSLLSKRQETMSSRAPSMSFICHFMYAVLQWRRKCAGTIAWKLQDLATFLDEHHSSRILPSEIPLLNDILLSLSSKGVVMYLQNDKKLAESWIVVDTEALLNKIIGKLLNPSHFKEHQKIASDAGIVHSSSLQQLFSDYNLEMIVGFLEALELCHRVNLSATSTNLMSRETHIFGDVEGDLFFPSLLSACRPRTISEEEFSFGWCLSLKNEDYQFFTSRFLHVLLLRLAYTFPLVGAHAHIRQEKYCTVWVNGISWHNSKGIRTIVELIDYNQCVVVAMSHRAETRQLEYLKHRSSVIKLVLDLQQELGPHLKKSEYLVDLPLLKRWSTDDLCVSTSNLLPIENVCRSMLLRESYILTNMGASSDFSTKQILEFEPYYQLSPSTVCELMDSIKTDADKPVSSVLLHEMRTCFEPSLQPKTRNYLSLRECLDKMSLFAGRNPIVSAEYLYVFCDYQNSSYLQEVADLSCDTILNEMAIRGELYAGYT